MSRGETSKKIKHYKAEDKNLGKEATVVTCLAELAAGEDDIQEITNIGIPRSNSFGRSKGDKEAEN